MPKYFPKILTIFFLAIFIFQLSCLLFLALAPKTGNAADGIEFTPQIQVGDYKFDASDKSTGNIARYIREIYRYAIGVVGILAAVVLMIGGVIWIVAGGNAAQIGEAKSWIGASLTGLVIALCSYIILATVNPALVDLKTTGIEKVTPSLKTNFDYSTPCGQPVPNQNIICGSKCPDGQICEKMPYKTPGAQKCPETLTEHPENDDYYICRKKEENGAANPDCCENNNDAQCLSGYVCNMKMTNYSALSCYVGVSGKGVCAKLQEKSGDCMEDPDCKSNKCNNSDLSWAWNRFECE